MWGGRRDSHDRIAMITFHQGDVRTKFSSDVKWQRASGGQGLEYNDSIYAGANSSAKIQIGESEMTLTENSLIVLRRDQNTSFLNLNYGSIFGNVAKGEKVVIDTGDGKPIELRPSKSAQIVVRKGNKGRTTLDVVSGDVEVTVNGKSDHLSKSNQLVFDQAPAPHLEQLKLELVKPVHAQTFYSEDPGRIAFEWKWANGRRPTAEDQFKLQFSSDPAFSSIRLNRDVQGLLTTELNASQSVNLYYRVLGPHGEISPVDKVSFVRMIKPQIVKPIAGSVYPEPVNDKSLIEAEFRKPELADVDFEVSATPDFSQAPVVTESLSDSKRVMELPTGRYYLRARNKYAEAQFSGWSETVPFSVARKVDTLSLPPISDRSQVIVPNRIYPQQLYTAQQRLVREYLHKHGLLQEFFPPGFERIHVQVSANNGKPQIIQQASVAWPSSHLEPGHYDFRYAASKSGFKPSAWTGSKSLDIAMEPPKPVGEVQYQAENKDGTSTGHWRFTPLLFAKSYDVEIAHDTQFQSPREIKVKTAQVSAPVSGENYWRVRARDAQGRIISEFSRPYKLSSPVPSYLAKNEAAARQPAAVESTTASLNEMKEQTFVKNGWWGWVGSGENYVDYRQSQPGISTLKDEHFRGLSQYIEAGFTGQSGWGGDISYKNTPGIIQPNNATVSPNTYAWTTLGLEGVYHTAAPFSILGSPVIYGLRLGLQQHKMPFVFVDEVGNLLLKTNDMTDASAGLLLEWSRRRWTYYWLMRYQYPLTSKADGASQWSMQPVFAFDGSIGASYNITRQLKLGLFWYGQWHQFNYTYSDGTVVDSGFQSLFYSNVDVRLGIDF
jgi:hypothetical protein